MSFIEYALIFIGAATVSILLVKFISYLDHPKKK